MFRVAGRASDVSGQGREERRKWQGQPIYLARSSCSQIMLSVSHHRFGDHFNGDCGKLGGLISNFMFTRPAANLQLRIAPGNNVFPLPEKVSIRFGTRGAWGGAGVAPTQVAHLLI